MKKMTVLALVASLSLAAPALAQTPADVKNFRDPSATSYVAPAVEETVVAPATTKATKKSKKSKKSSKKSQKTTTKTEETKTETKTETKK